MSATLLLVVALALLVGVTLGTLGGGGGILTLPLLLYVAHFDQHAAIVGSLLLVGATSAVSFVMHRASVRYAAGLPFAAASMVGSYVGGQVSHAVPPRALLLGFCAAMLGAGVAMLRKREAARPADDTSIPSPPRPRYALLALLALLGVGVGLLSGLVGAGGGFLIVPAFSLFAGLGMREAIATSLFVLMLQATAALAGHAAHTPMPWSVALPATAAAIVGSLAGSRLGKRAPPETLRRAFAIMILAVATLMLLKSFVLS